MWNRGACRRRMLLFVRPREAWYRPKPLPPARVRAILRCVSSWCLRLRLQHAAVVALPHLRHRRRHEERPDNTERSFDVFVPFGREVRVARLAACAEGDGRDAEGDRHVCVGRRARQLGVAAERAVGGDRRFDQRVGARCHAGWPVAQELDLDAQRRRAGGPAAVLVVGGALERRAHRDVELRQGTGILAAEIQVEPRLLWNGVQTRAAAEPHHGAGGPRGLLSREVGEQRGGAPHGIRRVGDAERRPRMAAGAAERDVIALGAQGAMDHPIETGAVQGDEGRRGHVVLAIQQMLHAPQISRPFFSDGGREQDGPRHRDASSHHRLRHRNERGEAAGVVRYARALEPLAAALHRDVHLGAEHGIEMRCQHHGPAYLSRLPPPVLAKPPVHVAGVVDRYVRQADLAEQLGQVCGAPGFRTRGRGDGRERRLARERHLIGALDVMARRANALVREQARNKIVHQLDSQCSHKPPAARRKRACGLRDAACGLWLSGRHLLMDERELIYDWNRAGGEGGPAFDWSRVRVDLNDETLRDGLQSPSVRDPALEVKKRLLHLMADLGIVAADIGLPGAGPRVVEQVRALATEIRNAKLPLAPNCAARTVIADVEPIVRVVQEVGITIEAATFIGSSPIRQYAEDWTLDRIVQATVEGVTDAVKHGLPVMYVTEDTTRAKPEALKALYGAAIDCGATRICLADTVGHATPAGVKALVEFVKREIVKQNRVKVDWHGHRDRGLGLINCLTAIEAGVDRVHGTARGVGEWRETDGNGPEDEAPCRAWVEPARPADRVLSDEECHRLLKQAAWRWRRSGRSSGPISICDGTWTPWARRRRE